MAERTEIKIRDSVTGDLEADCGPGGAFVAVRVRPCFPFSHPGRFLALSDLDGERELALIDSWEHLDAESRSALESRLARASFALEITAIDAVEDGPALRQWQVQTAQGPRRFLTGLGDWPRLLDGGGVLIRDVSEDHYLVRDPHSLDEKSRELLWSFMD